MSTSPGAAIDMREEWKEWRIEKKRGATWCAPAGFITYTDEEYERGKLRYIRREREREREGREREREREHMALFKMCCQLRRWGIWERVNQNT